MLTLAILLCADFAFAQTPQTQNNSGFISSSQCVPVPAGGMSSGGYSVTGTWSGTLTAYGIVGQGAAAALGSETANGSYTLSISGYTLFEVCGNTVGSGAAFVQVYSSTATSGSGSGISSLALQNNGSTVGTSSSATTLNFLSGCTSTYSTGTFSLTCSGGSMTWPGAAGIANYSGSSSWGTSYSATNLIPANFISTLNQNTTGTAGGLSGSPAITVASCSGCYSLPTATNSVLGGVKPDGTSILNTSGAISVTPTSVGLGNVTNNAQTQAAIVPNTAPGAGQVLAGNSGGTAYAPVSLSQDCTMTSAGVVTCTKSNNVAFGTGAFAAAPLSNIANTTITIGTTAVAANTCTSNSTATMTGVATTSTFSFTPNASVTGVTGWGSSGGLVIAAYPTSNTLNYSVCNQTASSITPSASVTFNVSAR
jgi:hypothetical protein